VGHCWVSDLSNNLSCRSPYKRLSRSMFCNRN